MHTQSLQSRSVINLCIQSLKGEHAACVRMITKIADDPTCEAEINIHLTRINNINKELVRLAGAYLTP